MLNAEPLYKKPSFWRRAIPIAMLLWWLFAFREEYIASLNWTLDTMRRLISALQGSPMPPLMLTLEEQIAIGHDLVVAAASVFFGIFVFFVFLQLVSQFVLPVRSVKDKQLVFDRLLFYLFGAHGPAVFIQEGEIVATPEELKSSLPGVAFVDLTSAIVLERQPTAWSGSGTPTRQRQSSVVMRQLRAAIEGYNPQKNEKIARAVGPGVVFIHEGERIRGVASLRKQFRIQLNVEALTGDGFKVAGHVIAIFSLGDPPEVIPVGYCVQDENDPNPFRPENLRALQVDEKNNKLTGFSEEFDATDLQEIHLYAGRARISSQPPAPPTSSPQFQTPYTFDEQRVFQAVYADARRPNEDVVEKWQDLPLKVAIESFRHLLSAEKYSELYKPADGVEFPFMALRGRWVKAVRNQAMLSFQFMRRRDGKPFVKGQPWVQSELEIFPVQALRSPKILRDRGIRMIVVTCPEIKPTNPLARQQQLEYWRSQRQREIGIARAPYDYQEIKVRAKARALAEREIVVSLRDILEDTSIPSEAIALRLLQALENFAHQPAAEGLLPRDTIRMLSSMHEWMFAQNELPSAGDSAYNGTIAGELEFPDEDEDDIYEANQNS